MHDPLQHSAGELQGPPSGVQLDPQMPEASHTPLQHWALLEQLPPSGVHIPQVWPQILPTSCTHKLSQKLVQQNGSVRQILAMHGLQELPSAGPVTQGSCEQLAPPQMPFEHGPEQHCWPVPHIAPSGKHMLPWQMPPAHWPLQHCWPAPHIAPSGKHGGPWQMPPAHWPLQHSLLTLHPLPAGLHAPQGKPQSCGTWFTQTSSQNEVQQNGSAWQTAATHGPHIGLSGSPVTQGP
jgi:hypothetical protein